LVRKRNTEKKKRGRTKKNAKRKMIEGGKSQGGELKKKPGR